jgi:hypothetical protein
MLDSKPLPELLSIHLNLPAGVGLRIQNIHTDSPAHKAGLERDDIIVAIDNQDANDLQGFIQNISGKEIGTEVTLEIIHKGQRKTVSLILARYPQEFIPKYPPEPQVSSSWRPGNVFRLDPNSNQWLPMPEATLPDMKTHIHKSMEIRTYHYFDGNKQYTVIIQGDPHEDDTQVTVQSGQTQYQTTIDELDALPKPCKEQAKRAIYQARKQARQHNRSLVWKQHSQAMKDFLQENQPDEYTEKILENLRRRVDHLNLPKAPQHPLLGPDQHRLNQFEERLRQMEQRLRELEKGRFHHNMPGQPSDDPNTCDTTPASEAKEPI